MANVLRSELVGRVLQRLGVPAPRTANLDSLREIYRAWCERITFDNVQKRIHLASLRGPPFPGTDAVEFFDSWLAHGVGGTCWATAGSFQHLLTVLGFQSHLVLGTMLRGLAAQPNHGSVAVEADGALWLMDTSLLHAEPLRLLPDQRTEIAHPARPVSATPRGSRWHVDWKPFRGGTCTLRLEKVGADPRLFWRFANEVRTFHPVNFQIAVRTLRGDTVVGIADGQRGVIRSNGEISLSPLSSDDRERFLVGELGYSADIVKQIPADMPLPAFRSGGAGLSAAF